MPISAIRLRRLREAKGFETAEDFANEYGYKPTTYRSHEGTRGVPYKAAVSYASVFGISPEWIMGSGPDEFPPEFKPIKSLDNGKKLGEHISISRLEHDGNKPQGLEAGETSERRFMPAYGSTPAPDGGWLLNPLPSYAVPVPDELSKIENPKAYLMVGDEMWPRVKHGELLWLQPGGRYLEGDVVVIVFKREPEAWCARDFISADVVNVKVCRYGRDAEGKPLIAEEIIPWSDIKTIIATALRR